MLLISLFTVACSGNGSCIQVHAREDEDGVGCEVRGSQYLQTFCVHATQNLVPAADTKTPGKPFNRGYTLLSPSILNTPSESDRVVKHWSTCQSLALETTKLRVKQTIVYLN